MGGGGGGLCDDQYKTDKCLMSLLPFSPCMSHIKRLCRMSTSFNPFVIISSL